MERKPDECAIALQGLADILDTDFAHPLTVQISDAVADHARAVIFFYQSGIPRNWSFIQKLFFCDSPGNRRCRR
jgi:hypothetical protein